MRRYTGALSSFVVKCVRSWYELRVGGIVIQWRDQTAPVSSLIDYYYKPLQQLPLQQQQLLLLLVC